MWYGTFKFIDFKKSWYIKVPVVPPRFNAAVEIVLFVIWFQNLNFCRTKIEYANRNALKWFVSRGGKKVQLVMRAYMPTIYQYV